MNSIQLFYADDVLVLASPSEKGSFLFNMLNCSELRVVSEHRPPHGKCATLPFDPCGASLILQDPAVNSLRLIHLCSQKLLNPLARWPGLTLHFDYNPLMTDSPFGSIQMLKKSLTEQNTTSSLKTTRKV